MATNCSPHLDSHQHNMWFDEKKKYLPDFENEAMYQAKLVKQKLNGSTSKNQIPYYLSNRKRFPCLHSLI